MPTSKAENQPESALAEAKALHRSIGAVDLHADPLLWSHWLGYDLLRVHRPPFPRARFGGHFDLPRSMEGSMRLQVFGLVALPGLDWNLAEACRRQMRLFRGMEAKSGGRLRAILKRSDLDALSPETLGGVFCMEGAHPLGGRLSRLEGFFAEGLRALGLVHFSANACGAPSKGLGANESQGLKAFGREVVARCEDLGILVDLAHLNKRGFMEACAMARRPMMVSHTGVRALHDIWRNIDDEQLRALAKGGGVAGVIFCPYYLGGDGIEAVVHHLEHTVRVAGEDAAALGSDWDGFIRPTTGLEEASKLPALTQALRARGMREGLIRKILRENAWRVLRESLPSD